jgi:hypothetical protein
MPQPAAYELARGLAIETRYLGPTDHKGSRIAATCKRDSETTFRAVVPYDHSTDCLGAHYVAALAVLAKIEAQNDCYSFTLQAVAGTERGYAFVTEAHGRP